MPYGFTCDAQLADACEGDYADQYPPFMGEFTETFLKTHGGRIAEHFEPGETVTICAACAREIVL